MIIEGLALGIMAIASVVGAGVSIYGQGKSDEAQKEAAKQSAQDRADAKKAQDKQTMYTLVGLAIGLASVILLAYVYIIKG